MKAEKKPAAEEPMVDISQGYIRVRHYKEDKPARHSTGSGANKKKIILIAGIVAGVAVLGAAGFLIFNSLSNRVNLPASTDDKTFMFSNKTVISGIDVTGKNLRQTKLLLSLNEKSFIKPVNISVKAGDKEATLTEADFDYSYNIDAVIEQAKQDAFNGVRSNGPDGLTYSVNATATEDSINSKTSSVCKKFNTKPINAHVTTFHPYSDNRFEIAEAEDGCKVDEAALKNSLVSALGGQDESCVIEAKVETEHADCDAATLKSKLVKLASYETYSYNTENGTHNMGVALSSCNGSIIEPDETWSFNECTGDSNLASNGYLPANVISNGKIEQGNGGGICQASSTIYNAAIRSNMTIVERYSHKWASTYVPTGLDATIDYPGLDLKLSNPSKFQMFLECKLVDSTLYATIWGVKEGNYDEIHTSNQLVSSDSSGYSVRAWRVYLKDGAEIDREELPSSRYDPEHGMVFIEADNDTQAVDSDVDDLEPSSSQTEYSDTPSQSSEDSYSEPEYTEPEPDPWTESEPDPWTEPEPDPTPDPWTEGGE